MLSVAIVPRPIEEHGFTPPGLLIARGASEKKDGLRHYTHLKICYTLSAVQQAPTVSILHFQSISNTQSFTVFSALLVCVLFLKYSCHKVVNSVY